MESIEQEKKSWNIFWNKREQTFFGRILLFMRTNFVAKKTWSYPKAFTDRFGTYLFAENVAIGISEILNENLNGIIHVVGNEKISMYELAKITTPDILPMTIKEYDGPTLTMDMSLDSERWKKYVLK